MNLLVTGGCGFIGSNFINHRINTYNDNILNVDVLTYAGKKENVLYKDRKKPFIPQEGTGHYVHVQADVNNTDLLETLFHNNTIDAVVHFAAESHVDRSISDSGDFIRTNICGTHSLLEAYLHAGAPGRFVHVSTDEVYGDLTDSAPPFSEMSYIKPNSPYAASKASSDLLCRSYHETHNLPIMITRCSNNYGMNQYPEKLIPLMVKKACNDEKLPVYGTGKNKRDWIHVLDHCRAISAVINRGEPGEVYNVGANNEIDNLTIVKMILKQLNKPEDLIAYVEDRKGHDWRYAINSNKIQTTTGWGAKIDFEHGLNQTIEHYERIFTNN